jgi:hypothetical protein
MLMGMFFSFLNYLTAAAELVQKPNIANVSSNNVDKQILIYRALHFG